MTKTLKEYQKLNLWLSSIIGKNRFSITLKRLEKVWTKQDNCSSCLVCATQYWKKRLAYKSKHNFKCEKQVILLIITDDKKWRHLTVKSLSTLLKGISSNHVGDFYFLNCFHSYRTEKKPQKTWNDHSFKDIVSSTN